MSEPTISAGPDLVWVMLAAGVGSLAGCLVAILFGWIDICAERRALKRMLRESLTRRGQERRVEDDDLGGADAQSPDLSGP